MMHLYLVCDHLYQKIVRKLKFFGLYFITINTVILVSCSRLILSSHGLTSFDWNTVQISHCYPPLAVTSCQNLLILAIVHKLTHCHPTVMAVDCRKVGVTNADNQWWFEHNNVQAHSLLLTRRHMYARSLSLQPVFCKLAESSTIITVKHLHYGPLKIRIPPLYRRPSTIPNDWKYKRVLIRPRN